MRWRSGIATHLYSRADGVRPAQPFGIRFGILLLCGAEPHLCGRCRRPARHPGREVGTLRAQGPSHGGRGALAQWQSSGLLTRGFRVRPPGAPPVETLDATRRHCSQVGSAQAATGFLVCPSLRIAAVARRCGSLRGDGPRFRGCVRICAHAGVPGAGVSRPP